MGLKGPCSVLISTFNCTHITRVMQKYTDAVLCCACKGGLDAFGFAFTRVPLCSRVSPPRPCSWKRSWRNAKCPITASQCASCWKRYRRTAATSQDGDRRRPSEWPMPLLWWVCVKGGGGGVVISQAAFGSSLFNLFCTFVFTFSLALRFANDYK